MKLSQLFTGSPHTEETVHTGQTQSARSVAEINRQIRSLVPGQTIRGEVMSRNGGEVQIRLSEDMVLNARVDSSINLEQGKLLTFEVKNNGSMLSLSPLFTNVATDVNVLKALEMAGLPVNQSSVSMTEQLMEAGLSVNRNSLQQVYREINSFPESRVSDVIYLHKLQIPVNEANVQQMVSYRNFTHQLINGLTDILDALPETVESMLSEGNIQGAESVYNALFRMAGESAETTEAFSSQTVAVQETSVEDIGETVEMAGQMKDVLADAGGTEDGISGRAITNAMPDNISQGGAMIIPEATQAGLTDNLLQILNELQLSTAEREVFAEQLQHFGQGEMSRTEFFDMAQKLLETSTGTDGRRGLLQLFSGKDFRALLTERLKSNWTLKPEDVSQPEKVENLYRRLDRQLKGLVQTLESAGQQGSNAYRAVTNVSQNVDFMNQLNQMYTYVQLPLRLQQSDAHGDLYVYTNRRSLADSDGKVSALLHLDMENLGSLDVYVTLQNMKVNTKFSVADEEILVFLEAHMELLTERLQKRGYDCSCTMSTEGIEKEESAGGLAPLLGQDRGILLSQYAFDVRT